MTLAPSKRTPQVLIGRRSSGQPVVLATLGVPLDDEAAAFAVDSAVESGRELLLVNVTPLEPLRMSIVLGYDALPEFTPEVSASLQSSAELARSLGVRVERLRIRSPRPVRALLDLVRERRPGVLVFGPDPSSLRPRRYRKAARTLLDLAGCLVWVSPSASSEPGA